MSNKIGNCKPLAPMPVTNEQRQWLEMEKGNTDRTYAVIVRRLIQAEVDKAKKKGLL